jgi:rubrerythrin
MKETLRILTEAYIGESQARNRYTFYASIAKKEGYIQISQIFETTALQEKEHASWLFKMIQDLKEGNEFEVTAKAPLILGDTKENLKSAVEGEMYENKIMYPDFAKIAKDEGLDSVAKRLESIAIAEGHHAERYQKLLTVLEDGSIFKKDKPVVWVCAECGYVYVGEEPPELCPSCSHPKGYYYLMNEEY